jgi:hypothetical protein
MTTENVAQEHTTPEEEEGIVRNWQSDGVVPMDHIIAPRINSVTYYRRGGLGNIEMTVTSIIFLSSKRYGNPPNSFLFKKLLHVVH